MEDSLLQQVQLNNTRDFLGEAEDVFCKNCNYYYWHDTTYENMLFDLRSMNE